MLLELKIPNFALNKNFSIILMKDKDFLILTLIPLVIDLNLNSNQSNFTNNFS